MLCGNVMDMALEKAELGRKITENEHGDDGTDDCQKVEDPGCVLKSSKPVHVDVGHDKEGGDGELDGDNWVDFADEACPTVRVEVWVGVVDWLHDDIITDLSKNSTCIQNKNKISILE